MRKWMTDKLFLYHWVRISILLFIYDIIVMNVSYGLRPFQVLCKRKKLI